MPTSTLNELIAQLDLLSDDDTIYAWTDDGHWFANSPAVVRSASVYFWHADGHWVPYSAIPELTLPEQLSEELPPAPEPIPQCFQYFLEVNLAREVVEVARQWFGPTNLTSHHEVLAVIYYAENDAYIPELPAV